MSIVVVGDIFTFPYGNAATNRIYTYAKGFVENGEKVYVVCIANEYTENISGTTDGIHYYNAFNQKKRNNSFFVRRWQKINKYFRAYRILKKINKEEKIIAINRWTNSFFVHIISWIYAKLLGTKLILETNEHPLSFFQKGAIRKKIGKIKFYLEATFCDGVLCISRYLVDLHLAAGIPVKKLFLVPSTVDPSRFIKAGEKPLKDIYIGYFGSLTFSRDNVDMLIKGFAQVHQQNKNVKLVLGGFCDDEQRAKIRELIKTLGIEDNVNLVQYLSREEIARYIMHADILVMVRSRDLQSDASYPSKLTEYLATGNPVVSVNVGEVGDFLQDGVNAFLVKPGDFMELASRLNYVLNNPEDAKVVSAKGKELTKGIFNYDYQSKKILEFITSLNSKK